MRIQGKKLIVTVIFQDNDHRFAGPVVAPVIPRSMPDRETTTDFRRALERRIFPPHRQQHWPHVLQHPLPSPLDPPDLSHARNAIEHLGGLGGPRQDDFFPHHQPLSPSLHRRSCHRPTFWIVLKAFLYKTRLISDLISQKEQKCRGRNMMPMTIELQQSTSRGLRFGWRGIPLK